MKNDVELVKVIFHVSSSANLLRNYLFFNQNKHVESRLRYTEI